MDRNKQLQLDVVNDDKGNMHVQVSIRCMTRPGLITRGTIPVTRPNLRHQVTILAGSIAEQHCEKYADRTDPDAIARAAERVFSELGVPG